jgi:hypothetical protein
MKRLLVSYLSLDRQILIACLIDNKSASKKIYHPLAIQHEFGAAATVLRRARQRRGATSSALPLSIALN